MTFIKAKKNRAWKREYKAKVASQIEFLETRSKRKDDDVRRARSEMEQMEKVLSCAMDQIGPVVELRKSLIRQAEPRLIELFQDGDDLVFRFTAPGKAPAAAADVNAEADNVNKNDEK